MTPGLFTIHQDGRAKFKKKGPKRPLFSEANKKVKGLSCKSARTERRASEPASCRIYAEASVESQQEEPQPHFAVSHALLCISSSGKWTSQTKHRHSEGANPLWWHLKPRPTFADRGRCTLQVSGVHRMASPAFDLRAIFWGKMSRYEDLRLLGLLTILSVSGGATRSRQSGFLLVVLPLETLDGPEHWCW